MMTVMLASDLLGSIFLDAASNPKELCVLSAVCRDWRALIIGSTRESSTLWDGMERRWWKPLLQQDFRGQDRFGRRVYGKLDLGLSLDRFGSSGSRQELCYRYRLHTMLVELKNNMVTGKRSIEIAEQLMGSGDYVDGRAGEAAMRKAIQRGLVTQILVSERSPFACDFNGPCGGECCNYDDTYCSETDEEADEQALDAQRSRHEDERREQCREAHKEWLNENFNDHF